MSRDPTVPVNLTTTTPVGPVERTLAATQATDRVERLRYWRRGGSALAYYIDPSFGSGGDGSYASPWDDFTEINALTGDLGGRILRLKSGQTIYNSLLLNAASNFSIETYGGSPQAIIDGSALASGWTWTNASGDLWSTASAGSEKALFLGTAAFERANNGQTVPVQAVMDRCEMTFWYGTHSVHGGGNLLWVHAPAGVNMNTETAAGNVRVQSRDFPLRGVGCSNVTVSNIHVQRGIGAVLAFNSHGAGLTLDSVIVKQCGYTTAGVGQDLVDISGVSAGAPATGMLIKSCQFLENFSGQNNNATEFSWINGLTIQDCTYRRILGNAVEYWQTVKNARVTRCRFEDIDSSILWLADNTPNQEHENNQIDNCIINSTGNMLDDASTDQQGARLLRHQAGTNTRVINNTFVGNTMQAVTLDSGTSANCLNTVTMLNNIFISTQAYAGRARFQTLNSPTPSWTFVTAFTGAKNEILSNNNRLFSMRSATQSSTNVGYLAAVGGYTVGLAAWQAQTGNPDANSSEGDPLLANMFGTVVGTTTLTAGVTSGTWDISVASAAGMTVGGYLTIPLTTTPRIHNTRIAKIVGTTITMESKAPSGMSNGATVSYRASLTIDATPSASGVLNSGIGSATNANVPTVDFFGNARSTTTPDIGAVEV